jgi:hypothetical protein
VDADQLLLRVERQARYPIRSVFTQLGKEIAIEIQYNNVTSPVPQQSLNP